METVVEGEVALREDGSIDRILASLPPFPHHGKMRISVSLNGGVQYMELPNVFNVYEIPTVPLRLEPSCGPLRGNTLLRIHGRGYLETGEIVVKFTDPETSTSRSVSARSHHGGEIIECRTPPLQVKAKGKEGRVSLCSRPANPVQTQNLIAFAHMYLPHLAAR